MEKPSSSKGPFVKGLRLLRPREGPVVPVSHIVLSYLPDEADPPVSDTAAVTKVQERQSREVEPESDWPIHKTQRRLFNWVAEDKEHHGMFTTDPDRMIPIPEDASQKRSCDICGNECKSRLYRFRCYRRRDFMSPEEMEEMAHQRLMHRFIAYVSLTCGRGLLGFRSNSVIIKEWVKTTLLVQSPESLPNFFNDLQLDARQKGQALAELMRQAGLNATIMQAAAKTLGGAEKSWRGTTAVDHLQLVSDAEDQKIELDPPAGMTLKEHVYQTLCSISWPDCTSRKNVMPEGKKAIKAFCLGATKPLFAPGLTLSLRSRRMPRLTMLLAKLAREEIPDADFRYTSVQLNYGYSAKLHCDKNNLGPSFIIGLGPYTGGELFVADEGQEWSIAAAQAPEHRMVVGDGKVRGYSMGEEITGRLLSIKSWQRFDGRIPHSALKSQGGPRISLVFFTRKEILSERINSLLAGLKIPTPSEEWRQQAANSAPPVRSRRPNIPDEEASSDDEPEEFLFEGSKISQAVPVDWTIAVELNVISFNAGLEAPISLRQMLPNATVKAAIISEDSEIIGMARKCKLHQAFKDPSVLGSRSGLCHIAKKSKQTLLQEHIFHAAFQICDLVEYFPMNTKLLQQLSGMKDDPRISSKTFLETQEHLRSEKPPPVVLIEITDWLRWPGQQPRALEFLRKHLLNNDEYLEECYVVSMPETAYGAQLQIFMVHKDLMTAETLKLTVKLAKHLRQLDAAVPLVGSCLAAVLSMADWARGGFQDLSALSCDPTQLPKLPEMAPEETLELLEGGESEDLQSRAIVAYSVLKRLQIQTPKGAKKSTLAPNVAAALQKKGPEIEEFQKTPIPVDSLEMEDDDVPDWDLRRRKLKIAAAVGIATGPHVQPVPLEWAMRWTFLAARELRQEQSPEILQKGFEYISSCMDVALVKVGIPLKKEVKKGATDKDLSAWRKFQAKFLTEMTPRMMSGSPEMQQAFSSLSQRSCALDFLEGKRNEARDKMMTMLLCKKVPRFLSGCMQLALRAKDGSELLQAIQAEVLKASKECEGSLTEARFWKKFAEELKGEEQSRKYAHGYQAKANLLQRLEEGKRALKKESARPEDEMMFLKDALDQISQAEISKSITEESCKQWKDVAAEEDSDLKKVKDAISKRLKDAEEDQARRMEAERKLREEAQLKSIAEQAELMFQKLSALLTYEGLENEEKMPRIHTEKFGDVFPHFQACVTFSNEQRQKGLPLSQRHNDMLDAARVALKHANDLPAVRHHCKRLLLENHLPFVGFLERLPRLHDGLLKTLRLPPGIKNKLLQLVEAGCFQTAHEPPVPDGYERRKSNTLGVDYFISKGGQATFEWPLKDGKPVLDALPVDDWSFPSPPKGFCRSEDLQHAAYLARDESGYWCFLCRTDADLEHLELKGHHEQAKKWHKATEALQQLIATVSEQQPGQLNQATSAEILGLWQREAASVIEKALGDVNGHNWYIWQCFWHLIMQPWEWRGDRLETELREKLHSAQLPEPDLVQYPVCPRPGQDFPLFNHSGSSVDLDNLPQDLTAEDLVRQGLRLDPNGDVRCEFCDDQRIDKDLWSIRQHISGKNEKKTKHRKWKYSWDQYYVTILKPGWRLKVEGLELMGRAYKCGCGKEGECAAADIDTGHFSQGKHAKWKEQQRPVSQATKEKWKQRWEETFPVLCREHCERMEAERLPVWRQWLESLRKVKAHQSEPVEPSSAKRRRVEPPGSAAPGNPAAEKLQAQSMAGAGAEFDAPSEEDISYSTTQCINRHFPELSPPLAWGWSRFGQKKRKVKEGWIWCKECQVFVGLVHWDGDKKHSLSEEAEWTGHCGHFTDHLRASFAASLPR